MHINNNQYYYMKTHYNYIIHKSENFIASFRNRLITMQNNNQSNGQKQTAIHFENMYANDEIYYAAYHQQLKHVNLS